MSADPGHADDVERAARWVADYVREMGGTAELTGPRSHPLVVGEVPASRAGASDEVPTVLLYGHYDVQPPGDLDAWESPPFEPRIHDGWLYGRGSADDKGNFFLLLRAVRELRAEGALPVHVRILSDGEEEIIGHSVVEYLRDDHREALACVIFDGPMLQRDRPLLVVGTRGLLYFHVRLSTGRSDMHSGFFGGAALNAGHAVARMVAELEATWDELEPGFDEPSVAERSAWAELPDPEDLLAAFGARPADASAVERFYERTTGRFAADINGIHCGEARLQKTVIPVEASVNLSLRLVPGQDPEIVSASLEEMLRRATPSGADVEIERWACTPAALMPSTAPVIEQGREAFRDVFGTLPSVVRTGGTVPIMSTLADRGIPTIMTGLDTLEGNAHAPNERLLLEYIPKGIEVAKGILARLSRLSGGAG